MTTGEAARILGVGLNTVKRWISSGDLRGSCTPGGHWRISNNDLYAFMYANGMQIPEKTKKHRARILIVDDDPTVCTLLEAILQQADFPTEIHCVHDGYTGLMRVGEWRPDILILDILMPGMDGLEVLRRIRANPGHNDMGIVVITAIFDQFNVTHAARSAGVTALLPKPIETQRVIDVIGAHLAASVANSSQPPHPKG